jgi:hypothetical protein
MVGIGADNAKGRINSVAVQRLPARLISGSLERNAHA